MPTFDCACPACLATFEAHISIHFNTFVPEFVYGCGQTAQRVWGPSAVGTVDGAHNATYGTSGYQRFGRGKT